MVTHVIRKAVWETNSSSSHSLVVSRTNYFDILNKKTQHDVAKMKQNIIDIINVKYNGVLKIRLGNYEWGHELLTTFEEKLSYILTDILQYKLDKENGDTDKDALAIIEDIGLYDLLKNELGIKKLKLTNLYNGSLDHESHNMVLETYLCEYDDKRIIDFLVDDTIWINITNDNRYKNRFDKLVHIIDANDMYNDKSAVETLENVKEWKKYDD